MLIVFSGIDCAGKSTQIDLLAAALKARGESVRVIWYRPGYSDRLDAARAMVRSLRPGSLPTRAQAARRRAAFARRDVTAAWVSMAILDTLVEYTLKVRTLLQLGHTVICDRYVDDACIDLDLRFPELASTSRLRRRLLEVLCPKPDLSILLTLPLDVMLQRMESKIEPFRDSPQTRNARYGAYMALTGERFVRVGAAASAEEVHSEILNAMARTGHEQ